MLLYFMKRSKATATNKVGREEQLYHQSGTITHYTTRLLVVKEEAIENERVAARIHQPPQQQRHHNIHRSIPEQYHT